MNANQPTYETFELLRPVVSAIDLAFTGTEITDNADGTYTIETCNTKWVTNGFTLTIAGNQYTVVDIEPNEWIKVSGSVIPGALTFNINAPVFVHGTVLAAVSEYNQVEAVASRLPMIWLHEITKERINEDPGATLGRISDCDIYFMVDADMENFTTVDHYKYCIRPMRNLLQAFKEALRTSGTTLFNMSDRYPLEYDQYDHARWGAYLRDKGHTGLWFNDGLSGTQMRINIPFKKTTLCCS